MKSIIHSSNLYQYLAAEIFKVKNGLSPESMKEIFIFQENEIYNLRIGNYLAWKNIQTTQYGIESVSNIGAKLWALLQREIKNSSLSVFENEIRKQILEICPCKLCQVYIENVCYIEFLPDICYTCRCTVVFWLEILIPMGIL